MVSLLQPPGGAGPCTHSTRAPAAYPLFYATARPASRPSRCILPQHSPGLDCQFERDTIKRAPYFELFGSKNKLARRHEFEAVVAAAQAGSLKVFAIAIGQDLADQLAAGVDVETDRRLGMVGVLRPAGNAFRGDAIDVAAQIADRAPSRDASPARSAMRCRTASTW